MKFSFLRLVVFCAVLFCFNNAYSQDTVWVAAPGDIDTLIFEKVEIEPSVDRRAWTSHLSRQLKPVIEKATAQGIKPGTYIVNVRFLVGKDGRISDVRALEDPGFGLAKAAERTVKSGPRWTPGEQGGRRVRTYHTQPFHFVISE